jgi:4-hydroxy-3-methylbut-2-en-1-yl diphosphate synthase IspG/GcpE
MKRSAPGNIIMICDGCKEPLQITPLLESSLKYAKKIICPSCGRVETELDELKNFSAQTRSYGHL